jgi:hypothetical protein
MAEQVTGRGGLNPWRLLGWGGAAALLLLPLVAMQFTQEVNWTLSDFIFAGLLFGLVGGLFELAVRLSGSIAYRIAAALGLGVSFLVVWANGAVGIIGNENDAINLVFFGILAVGLGGALIVRFRPEGMALAVSAMGALMLVMAAYVLATNPNREAVIIAFLAGLWFLSAGLFRKAAQEQKLASPSHG